MFDIGFWELSIIMVVALLVIGPERLPRVAKTAGLWMGKARRMVRSVKADIDLEMKTQDLKKTLLSQESAHEFTDTEAEIGRLSELGKSRPPKDSSGASGKTESSTPRADPALDKDAEDPK